MLSELENRRILLKELKLWVPMFQIGVPVYAYGFDRGTKAVGPGYRFDVAPQYDSWLVPDPLNSVGGVQATQGEVLLMPIETSSLYAMDVAKGYENVPEHEKCFSPIQYPRDTRFSRCFSAELGQDIIQLFVPTFKRVEEYSVKTYPLDRVWYEGPAITSG